MIIRRKRDALGFMKNFEVFSDWDGEKNFFTLKTEDPQGTLTIMKYSDNKFTFHRKNKEFWDVQEIEISKDDLTNLIWKNRKAINQCLRVTVA